MNRILTEVCCGSLEDALIAQQNGADRIELCGALFLGGLTPSYGTFLLARERLNIPIIAMVRPREAGFCYTDYELDVMREDAEFFLKNGADGIVFGFLNADGTLNAPRTRAFTELCHAHKKEAVLHRAFDVVKDPLEAFDLLVEMGVNRLLTSGREASAINGASFIKALMERAGGKMGILPGGGINEHNVMQLVSQTGAREVHFSARGTRREPSVQSASIRFSSAACPQEDAVSVTDGHKVAAICALLGQA